jgi:hypothetical protein
MGRYLNLVRELLPQVSGDDPPAKKANLAKKDTDELMDRLHKAGIAIAIDQATGAPLLIFNESGAEAVRHVAKIYRPFDDVVLTDPQRRELMADLDYYQQIMRRTQAERHR